MASFKDYLTNNYYFLSLDGIRGKRFYTSGTHVFEFNWPKDERGSHPVVGLCTGRCQYFFFSFSENRQRYAAGLSLHLVVPNNFGTTISRPTFWSEFNQKPPILVNLI